MAPLISALALAAMLSGGLANAQEGDPAKGLALARQACSECHAIDKTQARSPKDAAPRFEAIANVRGMTATALTVALRTPHRSMPNIVLEPDELRDVAAYILSLK
jgi:mono/diheme cytochrome c family protein